jgi:ubiquitin carboxyl-terminal hydrolase L3
MSNLAHELGLSKTLSFVDVYSIDQPDILATIPRPCYGLILVFPINEAYERYRLEEDEAMEEYNGYGEDEEVIWLKQTIGTACGIIALLHCVLNGDTRSLIHQQTELDNLLKTILPLQPIARANALCDCDALESANETAAKEGNSAVVAANTPMDLHFVCFAKSHRHNLWELDGRRRGPINKGFLGKDDDPLSEQALDLGVRKLLQREQDYGLNDFRFSLIALVSNTE